MVVEGDFDQSLHRLFGGQVVDVQSLLLFADPHIGFLHHRPIEPLLAAEMVIDHRLGGAGLGRDVVDPGALQALLGELLHGGEQDFAFGGFADRRFAPRPAP